MAMRKMRGVKELAHHARLLSQDACTCEHRDAQAHDAMPQLLLLGGGGMTLGQAVDIQELSGCKESHCTRRLLAVRDEKPGLWVYLPILLHLEGRLGVL